MLSKKAQYAIYALVRLAKEKNNNGMRIIEIAEADNIPKKFLETILLDLKNNGFLISKQGKNGGYFLLKQSDNINLADVIRVFDGAIALLPCAAQKYFQPCSYNKDETKCGVCLAFKKIRDETVKLMENTTIADIINLE